MEGISEAIINRVGEVAVDLYVDLGGGPGLTVDEIRRAVNFPVDLIRKALERNPLIDGWVGKTGAIVWKPSERALIQRIQDREEILAELRKVIDEIQALVGKGNLP